MALINLTSDLSDYFKKEPPKPTGRFENPKKDNISSLDPTGKLEKYKLPEIKMDPTGQPIVDTNLTTTDTKKKYSDQFESQLANMVSSIQITEDRLLQNEQSPVEVNEIETSGYNETSDVEPPISDPSGRNDRSTVIIPDMKKESNFTESGIDPIISQLRGRFETSEIEPVLSQLETKHTTSDVEVNQYPHEIGGDQSVFASEMIQDGFGDIYGYGDTGFGVKFTKTGHFDGDVTEQFWGFNNGSYNGSFNNPNKFINIGPNGGDLPKYKYAPGHSQWWRWSISSHVDGIQQDGFWFGANIGSNKFPTGEFNRAEFSTVGGDLLHIQTENPGSTPESTLQPQFRYGTLGSPGEGEDNTLSVSSPITFNDGAPTYNAASFRGHANNPRALQAFNKVELDGLGGQLGSTEPIILRYLDDLAVNYSIELNSDFQMGPYVLMQTPFTEGSKLLSKFARTYTGGLGAGADAGELDSIVFGGVYNAGISLEPNATIDYGEKFGGSRDQIRANAHTQFGDASQPQPIAEFNNIFSIGPALEDILAGATVGSSFNAKNLITDKPLRTFYQRFDNSLGILGSDQLYHSHLGQPFISSGGDQNPRSVSNLTMFNRIIPVGTENEDIDTKKQQGKNFFGLNGQTAMSHYESLMGDGGLTKPAFFMRNMHYMHSYDQTEDLDNVVISAPATAPANKDSANTRYNVGEGGQQGNNINLAWLQPYSIIEDAIETSEQGTTYEVVPTYSSPFSTYQVTGNHSGLVTDLYEAFEEVEHITLANLENFNYKTPTSFTVQGVNAEVIIPDATITGDKLTYNESELQDSTNEINTTLFGGKSLTQRGFPNPKFTFLSLDLNAQTNTGYQYFNGAGFGFTSGIYDNEHADMKGVSPLALYGGANPYVNALPNNFILMDVEPETLDWRHPGVVDSYSYSTAFENYVIGDSNIGTYTNIPELKMRSFSKNVKRDNLYNYVLKSEDGTVLFQRAIVEQTIARNMDATAEIDPDRVTVDMEIADVDIPLGKYTHLLSAYGYNEPQDILTGLGLDIEEAQQLPLLYTGDNTQGNRLYPAGAKLAVDSNFDISRQEHNETYESFVKRMYYSGALMQERYEAKLEKNNSSNKRTSVEALQSIMKKHRTSFRVWEKHNHFAQTSKGLHRGLDAHTTLGAGFLGKFGKANLLSGLSSVFSESAMGSQTAKKYYSVLGYPGLTVCESILSAGTTDIIDFRNYIGDESAQHLSDASIANYRVNNLFVRGGSYQQGAPGLMRRDYRQPTTTSKPFGGDAITQEPISGGSIESMEKSNQDLIKFYIENIYDDKKLRFRAYITNINDSIAGIWQTSRYIGRPVQLYHYEGAGERKISFNLKIAALSRFDVVPMWTKINYLTSLTMPNQADASRLVGPAIRLTLGDYMYREPGFLDSVNITVDPSSPWEINLEDSKKTGADKIVDAFAGGGFKGIKNMAVGKIKDFAKGKLLNQMIDEKGFQVAQLPHVVDIVLSFTSTATTGRHVGGPMFGFMDQNSSWQRSGETSTLDYPKKPLLDKIGFSKDSTLGKLAKGAGIKSPF